jgi:hypothetical protein
VKLLNLALLCALLFVSSAQAAIVESACPKVAGCILESLRLQILFGGGFTQGPQGLIHDGETNVAIGTNSILWDYDDGALTYRIATDSSFSRFGYGVFDPSTPVGCINVDGTPCWILFIPDFAEASFSAGDTKTFLIRTIPEPGLVFFSAFGWS